MKKEDLRDFIKSTNGLALALFAFVSMGVFFGTIIVLDESTHLSYMLKSILGILGIVTMIAATCLSITYRHLQGQINNFKNATLSRRVIYIFFNILFTLLFIWMAVINPYDMVMIVTFAVSFYLGTLLSFKYLIIKKRCKDHRLAIILIYLFFTIALILKYALVIKQGL